MNKSELWQAAREAESRYLYASDRVYKARWGMLGRITAKGLQSLMDAEQLFKSQYESVLKEAKNQYEQQNPQSATQ